MGPAVDRHRSCPSRGRLGGEAVRRIWGARESNWFRLRFASRVRFCTIFVQITSLDSALVEVFILNNLKLFRMNTYKKQGEGDRLLGTRLFEFQLPAPNSFTIKYIAANPPAARHSPAIPSKRKAPGRPGAPRRTDFSQDGGYQRGTKKSSYLWARVVSARERVGG